MVAHMMNEWMSQPISTFIEFSCLLRAITTDEKLVIGVHAIKTIYADYHVRVSGQNIPRLFPQNIEIKRSESLTPQAPEAHARIIKRSVINNIIEKVCLSFICLILSLYGAWSVWANAGRE